MAQKLTYLVIHCTATPEGRDVTPQDIRRWHTSPVADGGRGWKQVGYSDIIRMNGQVDNLVSYNEDNTVDPWEITNGASGINSISRHVVYAGGMDAANKHAKDTRNAQQLKAMELYVKDMVFLHPHIKVAGHNQFAAKACPSFDVPAWLRSIGIKEHNIYTK